MTHSDVELTNKNKKISCELACC